MRSKRFNQALFVLLGHIVGVGIFSLPYITVRSGIWMMLFYFIVLGGMIIIFEMIYGEIALRTKELHRLPGYAKKYLGNWARNIAFLSYGLGAIGAILAYIIVGGSFLYSILGPIIGGSSLLYIFAFFALGTLLIYFGIKSIAQTEMILFLFFFIVLGLVFYKNFSFIQIDNLLAFDLKYLFLPYGAILFSLSGGSIIPEIKEMLSDNLKDLKKVIFLATSIAILIYLFFIFLVAGISGSETTPEAIIGLQGYLSSKALALILIFGILANFTSFLTVGLTLKKTLWYDLGFNKNLSWLIACFAPLFLYLIGLNDFIVIISLSGGLLLAISAILVILIYLKAKTKGDLEPAYKLSLPRILIYFLMFLFILGAIYELIHFINI